MNSTNKIFTIILGLAACVVNATSSAEAADADFVFSMRSFTEQSANTAAMEKALKSEARAYCRKLYHSASGSGARTGCERAIVKAVREKISNRTNTAEVATNGA